MILTISDSLVAILLSENLLGISERSLQFSVPVMETTENFSDFSLIVSGFSLN